MAAFPACDDAAAPGAVCGSGADSKRLVFLRHLVDLAAQGAGFGVQWRNKRWVLWTLGMLLTVLFENYWIADEIYPDMPPRAAVHLAGGANAAGT